MARHGKREGKLVHANMTSVVKEPGVAFQGATHHGHKAHHKKGKSHGKHRYHDHHFMNH